VFRSTFGRSSTHSDLRSTRRSIDFYKRTSMYGSDESVNVYACFSNGKRSFFVYGLLHWIDFHALLSQNVANYFDRCSSFNRVRSEERRVGKECRCRRYRYAQEEEG